MDVLTATWSLSQDQRLLRPASSWASNDYRCPAHALLVLRRSAPAVLAGPAPRTVSATMRATMPAMLPLRQASKRLGDTKWAFSVSALSLLLWWSGPSVRHAATPTDSSLAAAPPTLPPLSLSLLLSVLEHHDAAAPPSKSRITSRIGDTGRKKGRPPPRRRLM